MHYLIEEDRVRAIYVAVPLDPALTAFRHSLAVLLKARAADVALIVEAPFRMPDRASELWRGALELDGVESCVSLLLAVICAPYRKGVRVAAHTVPLRALRPELTLCQLRECRPVLGVSSTGLCDSASQGRSPAPR